MIKMTYYCDYCGEVIEKDDTVCVLHPGRIGYQDSIIHDPEDSIRHFHDSCMEHLLCLQFSTDANINHKEPAEEVSVEQVPDAEEAPAEPDPEEEKEKPKKNRKKKDSHSHNVKDDYYGPVESGKKDLPALKALLDAGWTHQKCAEEFGVVISTIYKWKKEIMTMIESGTWDDYCESRRSKK